MDDDLGYEPDNCQFSDYKQQARNQRSPAHKKLPKGVVMRDNGRYRATINPNRQRISLGTFDTVEQAANAYKAAAIKYYGFYIE